MNDKWTQGELMPAIGWAKTYSRKVPKTWSFGLCAFSLFALIFMGSASIAVVASFISVIVTGANLVINTESVKNEIQSTITIMGYIISVLLIYYSEIYHSNVFHHI